jgi:hypothetical protein
VGYLPQEPQLEAGKTVGEEIEKAVSEIRGLLKVRVLGAGGGMGGRRRRRRLLSLSLV